MTASIVVFTEEPSARIVIDQLARKVTAARVQVLEHAGKADLEKSVRRKINGWTSPQVPRFIITRDLDRGNRESVKQRLLSLIPSHAVARTKIRIVVPELEVWYLGDPEALRSVDLINKNTAQRLSLEANFRNLCALTNAKVEFKKIVGNIGQIAAAELIAPALDVRRNSSVNLHAFVGALRWAETGGVA